MKFRLSWLSLLLLAALMISACAPIVDTSTRPVTLDGGIAGTVRQPNGAGPFPTVLMLHGFGSTKDEVGNLYAILADALADQGVASLRIDFRGFGKSDGDTGATTVGAQVEDAISAYNWLTTQDFVDTDRLGLLGFSLGGGVAMVVAGENPDWFDSLATWSSVGDFDVDFSQEPYDAARALAAEHGVVGMDLGFRTIVLKNEFFTTLKDYDLATLITQYPGAYLAIVGDQDYYAQYAPGFVESSPADPREAFIVPGGDHIYNVFSGDSTNADSVIARTAEWFASTLE